MTKSIISGIINMLVKVIKSNNRRIFVMQFMLFCAISLISAWVFSQTFKTFLNFCTTREFKIKMLFSDGDFPSTHTTTSVAAVIISCYELVPIALNESEVNSIRKIASAAIVIIVLWAAFIIRDALGIRLRVQELSHTVHTLLTTSQNVEGRPISDNLQEFWSELASGINLKVGHMPHEVIGGLILGVIFGFGASFLRHQNYVMFFVDLIAFLVYAVITFIVIGRNRQKK